MKYGTFFVSASRLLSREARTKIWAFLLTPKEPAGGFDISASKTVALQIEHTDAELKDHICDICGEALSEHSGGEATCTSKAVCEYCDNEYGELDSSNHTGGTEIRNTKLWIVLLLVVGAVIGITVISKKRNKKQ